MIYFILKSFSGDEAGIIYSRGAINMNGIKILQRIDGAFFYYQSWY
jgi:hypothetical protein